MIKFNAKKLSLLALYSAMALIVFVIESLVPSLIVPGAKIGLANLFVLLALYTFGVGEAFFVMLIKCVLGNLIAGNLSSLVFSVFGGVVCLAVCSLVFCFAKDKISVVALSVLGAVVSNMAQNAVYAFITQTTSVFFYLPYLALLGVLSGMVVGFTTVFVLKRLPKSSKEVE